MLDKPELMFLSLCVTTFYRKSFTFESQVGIWFYPHCTYSCHPGIAHSVQSPRFPQPETGLLPRPPLAGAGSDLSGRRRKIQELWHPGCYQQCHDVWGSGVSGHQDVILPLAGNPLSVSCTADEVSLTHDLIPITWHCHCVPGGPLS